MMIKSAPAFHMLSSTSHLIFCSLLVFSSHLVSSLFVVPLLIILSSHAMFSSSLFWSITFSSSLVSSHVLFVSSLVYSKSHLVSSCSPLSLLSFSLHLSLSPCSLLYFHLILSLPISCFFSSCLICSYLMSSLLFVSSCPSLSPQVSSLLSSRPF